MAKLTSLSDLSTLLSSDYKVAEKVQKQIGYDGKPVQIKVHIDKKGRGGKTVTIISGFQSKPDELDSLCQVLKKSCGSGGTVRDNLIEIQGDHRSSVTKKLQNMNYSVKEIHS